MSKYVECTPTNTQPGGVGGIQMKGEAKNPSQKNELDRWKRLLREISDPSCGRIQELKEKIRKNTLITKEAIEETAERLAARFFGKE